MEEWDQEDRGNGERVEGNGEQWYRQKREG